MPPERVKLAMMIREFHDRITRREVGRGGKDFLSGLVQAYAITYGFNNNTTAMHDAFEVASV